VLTVVVITNEACGVVGVTTSPINGNLREWAKASRESPWVRGVFRGVLRLLISRCNEILGRRPLLNPTLQRNNGIVPGVECRWSDYRLAEIHGPGATETKRLHGQRVPIKLRVLLDPQQPMIDCDRNGKWTREARVGRARLEPVPEEFIVRSTRAVVNLLESVGFPGGEAGAIGRCPGFAALQGVRIEATLTRAGDDAVHDTIKGVISLDRRGPDRRELVGRDRVAVANWPVTASPVIAMASAE
jgi:hypothetical protein